ncbi:type II toxin-antitoxin system RelB/DinJ family antitoxin [Variovorax sp. CY25R-8]|jgi:DNA-damage-inducible protein J|uniref:antitoxin PaaA2 family protein n=1 Tax=Variovorax sp. CY25R-8 TaxID=2855501 RepID=UPI0021BA663E|nr:type II toxin-antitoxin system RelB/DinJ family antitoxin [Variovorax sp. CY25R-8]MCT8176450.1 type II toxin-antitoxin system RelB/DinJ family antitoxin [Variovorax sp. CY25R-8]
MAANAGVKTCIDAGINDGALPVGTTIDAAYDPWFRAKVQEALDDPRPAVAHNDVEVHFSRRRAAALLRTGAGTK